MNSPLRIVVADDEPLLVRLLAAYLEDMGHVVVGTAADGHELVDRVSEEAPDVVITDIKMPEMDGLEAARKIRTFSSVPFIVVSAYHDEEFINRTTQDNISSYLVKPIDKTQLAIELDKLMLR